MFASLYAIIQIFDAFIALSRCLIYAFITSLANLPCNKKLEKMVIQRSLLVASPKYDINTINQYLCRIQMRSLGGDILWVDYIAIVDRNCDSKLHCIY